MSHPPKDPIEEVALRHISQKKVVYYLNQLDKESYQLFIRYLPCIDSVGKRVSDLLVFLSTYHPQITVESHPELTLGFVYRQLYASHSFHRSTIDNLFSQTHNAYKSFLKYQQFRKDEQYQSYSLLRSAYEMHENELFQSTLRARKSAAKKAPINDFTDFYYLYLAAQLEQGQTIRLHGWSQDPTHLKTMVHSLQNFYMGAMMRLICAFRNRAFQAHPAKEPYHFPLKREITDLISKNPITKEPYVQIWFDVFQLLEAPKSKVYFDNFKKKLAHYKAVLSEKELRQVCSILINYCGSQHLKHPNEFQVELFELFDFLIEHRLLEVNGYIATPAHFKNAVNSALAAGHLDWAKDLLRRFESKIHPNEQIQTYTFNYCRACIAFYEGNFADCLGYLKTNNKMNLFQQVAHRLLLIQANYELQDEDVRNNCTAFLAYLERNEKDLPAAHFTAFRFFVLIVKDLIRIREEAIQFGYSPHKLASHQDRLMYRISQWEPVKRDWLEAKVVGLGDA